MTQRLSHRLILVLTAAAALAVTAPARAQDDPCQAAIMADSAGELETAIAAYTECLENYDLQPEYQGMFLHQRGRAYDELGNPERAILDFTAALPLVPEPERTFSARGLAYAEIGEYEDSIYDFTQAINADPGQSSSWHMRGIIYIEAGDYDSALADYDEAVRLDPANLMAMSGRAELKARMGDRKGAIADYGEAIEIDPRFSRAYNGRAWYRFIEDIETEAALEDVEVALALEPDDADYADTKAHLLSSLGRQIEALEWFERSMELAGTDRVLWYQEELAAKGYYDGAADGEYDTQTRTALQDCIREDCRLLADVEF